MEKKTSGYFKKRGKVKKLLQAGEVSKADIAEQVGCSMWLVYDVDRKLNPVKEDSLVGRYVQTVIHNNAKYVSRQWLVINLGLVKSTISRHLKKEKIFFIEQIRLPYKVPARFFPLAEVWEKLPAWELKYEENKNDIVSHQNSDRTRFRDISDGQYYLLCALMEWWIGKFYWPSADDLLSLSRVYEFFDTPEKIRHHLRELQTKGYLTRLGPKVSRGKRSFNRVFQIHRGPKNLTTQLEHCPKCGIPFRVARPFFVPKIKTSK